MWESSVPVNPDVPTPLENDLMRGRVLLMHRPPSGEPFPWNEYFTHLEATKKQPAMCEVHFQFELKKPPQGTIWLGGEIREPMKLSFALRATGKALLALLNRFADVPLHYSFGSHEEHAHICFPLAHAKMCTSSSDDPWPGLGPDLPSLSYPSAPVSELTVGKVYTFAFSFKAINFHRWELCNIGALSGTPLRSFWKSNALHVLAYDVPAPGSTPSARRSRAAPHEIATRSVLLDFRFWHTSLAPEAEGSVPDAAQDIPRAVSTPEPFRTQARTNSPARTDPDPGYPSRVDSEDLALERALAAEDLSLPGEPTTESDDDASFCTAESPRHDSHEPSMSRSGSFVSVASGEESAQAGVHVSIPWIVTIKKEHFYILDVRQDGDSVLQLRSLTELLEVESIVTRTPNWRGKPSVQALEHHRGRFAQLFKVLLDADNSQDLAAGAMREVLSSFVSGDAHSSLSSLFVNGVGYVPYEGRIVSDRLSVRRGKLRFAAEAIEVEGIRSVQLRRSEDIFLHMFSCLDIDTWERRYRFLVHADGSIHDVLQVLHSVKPSSPWNLARLEDNSGLDRWQPVRRRVWNDRRLVWTSCTSPLALSMSLLRATASAKPADGRTSASAEVLSQLCDDASELKGVELHRLDRWELLAFWLNVYHALLLHGRLGSPDLRTLGGFVAFHNRTSYIVAGQTWSLTEIEHLILRQRLQDFDSLSFRWLTACWNRTSDVEKSGCMAVPNAHEAVRNGDDWLPFTDRRVNFALNCGSNSCCSTIFLFGTGNVDDELNSACREFLKEFPVAATAPGMFGKSTHAFILPRITKWYPEDSPDGTAEGWVAFLAGFDQKLPSAFGPSFSTSRPTYRAYDWRQRRHLKLAIPIVQNIC